MLASVNLDSDELDENVQRVINKLNKKFKEIEGLINDLMGNQFNKAIDVTHGMDAVETAKYYATMAFAIQSLYNVHLRLKNEETRIESCNVELERIKQSILKIKNAINFKQSHQNDNDKHENDDVEMNGNGNGNSNGVRMKLDKPAAKRFIANNLDKDARDKMYEEFGDEMKRK